MGAITHATLLSTCSMGMAISGGFWYYDISNVKEFTYRMKAFLGGDKAEKELKDMPLDDETRELTESLDALLKGDSLDLDNSEKK